MRARTASMLGLALAAALSGCSSPAARFYTLAATAQAEAGVPAVSCSVIVDGVSIPAAVDRPQFVLQKGPNRVAIDEFNRWAAPLAPSVARAVAENLVVLLGTPLVVSGPLASSFEPACRVAIDIQRFESIAGEAAMLDALWVVRGSGEPLSGRTSQRESVHGDGYEALAAAHSRTIARLSHDIAAAIRSKAPR